MEVPSLRSRLKIVFFILWFSATSAATFVLLNGFGALVLSNGCVGPNGKEEATLLPIGASSTNSFELSWNKDNLNVANATTILLIVMFFHIIPMRRKFTSVNKGASCIQRSKKGKKTLLRNVRLRRKRTLEKRSALKRTRDNSIKQNPEKSTSPATTLPLEQQSHVTPTKGDQCADRHQPATKSSKNDLFSTQELFCELINLERTEKDVQTVATEDIQKEVVSTMQKAKPHSLKRALDHLKAQRHEFRNLQNEFNAMTFATANARQSANYWTEAANEVQEATRAKERSRYIQHMQLIQKYKESIVECTKKAMLLRSQIQGSHKVLTKHFNCYDCRIGGHNLQPSNQCKNDIVNFLPTCPIGQEINVRYAALKLGEYVSTDIKLERISKLQKGLQRALFSNTFLRDGRFIFLS